MSVRWALWAAVIQERPRGAHALRPREHQVLQQLCWYASTEFHKNGERRWPKDARQPERGDYELAWAGVPELCSRCRCSPDTINTALRGLEVHGLILPERRPNHSSLHWFPEVWISEPSENHCDACARLRSAENKREKASAAARSTGAAERRNLSRLQPVRNGLHHHHHPSHHATGLTEPSEVRVSEPSEVRVSEPSEVRVSEPSEVRVSEPSEAEVVVEVAVEVDHLKSQGIETRATGVSAPPVSERHTGGDAENGGQREEGGLPPDVDPELLERFPKVAQSFRARNGGAA